MISVAVSFSFLPHFSLFPPISLHCLSFLLHFIVSLSYLIFLSLSHLTPLSLFPISLLSLSYFTPLSLFPISPYFLSLSCLSFLFHSIVSNSIVSLFFFFFFFFLSHSIVSLSYFAPLFPVSLHCFPSHGTLFPMSFLSPPYLKDFRTTYAIGPRCERDWFIWVLGHVGIRVSCE